MRTFAFFSACLRNPLPIERPVRKKVRFKQRFTRKTLRQARGGPLAEGASESGRALDDEPFYASGLNCIVVFYLVISDIRGDNVGAVTELRHSAGG